MFQRMTRRIQIIMTAAFSLAAAAAFADVLPGPAMPEQVAKSLRPKNTVAPNLMAPKEIIQPPSRGSGLTPAQEKVTFKLKNIVLTGNHVYTNEQLLPLYKDKLNKTISVADLFKIVESITNYYRNNGYILSFATLPPQRSHAGTITIQVVEGYINEVSVTGSPGGAKCLVEGFGYQVRKCPPLNIKPLEKYMLLANEIPNTTVKAVLGPSKSGLGAADLHLDANSKPWSAYFSYDDYGTRYIGPQQMTGNVAGYSLFNSGDSTQFTFTKTPKGKELTFMDLNYNGPIGDRGVRWLIGGTYVHTHPLFVLRPTQTDGVNENIYMSYIYPLIRTRSESLNGTASFSYLNSNSTILNNQPLYTDHIRSLDLGLNYNFADRYYGANQLSLDLRKGLPILNYSSDTSQFTAVTSRPGGYATYTKFGGQASRLQALKWNFTLLGVAKGQWTAVPLLSSEQYTFGGNPLGRGYDPAEIIGDRGASGSLELRYDWNVSRFYISTLQPYLFYDAGAIWNVLVNFTSPGKVSATSTGVGLRFTMTKYLSGNVMWAQPLTKQVTAEALIGNGWKPRTFFSVVASFG